MCHALLFLPFQNSAWSQCRKWNSRQEDDGRATQPPKLAMGKLIQPRTARSRTSGLNATRKMLDRTLPHTMIGKITASALPPLSTALHHPPTISPRISPIYRRPTNNASTFSPFGTGSSVGINVRPNCVNRSIPTEADNALTVVEVAIVVRAGTAGLRGRGGRLSSDFF